jgi:hypothetical protein
MRFFKQKNHSTAEQIPSSLPLSFASTKVLERALDGSDEAFAKYYFALYQCSPDEDAGINVLRKQLREKHPSDSTAVGKHFVLAGEAAYIALTSYYHALTQAETLSAEYRDYVAQRIAEIEEVYQAARGLPHPIDLTEGQLAHDPKLEFMTCIALQRSQVLVGTR